MEQEFFLSGYCRVLDCSRTVTLVTDGGKITEIDCCFESCIHAPACTVAEKIREKIKD